MLSRRDILAFGGAAAAAALLPLPARAAPLTLTAKVSPGMLPGIPVPSALWTYNDRFPLVLRIPRGQPFSALLKNALQEHTAIHWHGIRVPHAMDGVPYITQDPVEPGESFAYDFTPPDPGTFFFHPHCNTVEALGRGLAGVMIVEDPREAGLFDAEHVLALKDWRVKKDGSFEPFITDAGAAKAGSFGSLRTVNGGPPPVLYAAPGERLRLRILNIDNTRVPMLAVRGAGCNVIATDGNAVEPFPLETWQLGPAMRLDLALVAPEREGAEVFLEDVWSSRPRLLAKIVTRGAARRGAALAALKLPPAELPQPDVQAAVRMEMALLAGHADAKMQAWAKETGFSVDEICATQKVFWSINRQAWPGMSHEVKPPPLAELKSGRSYVIEFFNGTPHNHPMHLHGHTFLVMASNERRIRPFWADTVLVAPKERVQIAFVAGEPGDWMLHCHIIEHQETGMMGYLRVV